MILGCFAIMLFPTFCYSVITRAWRELGQSVKTARKSYSFVNLIGFSSCPACKSDLMRSEGIFPVAPGRCWSFYDGEATIYSSGKFNNFDMWMKSFHKMNCS